jgi:hypothetical protein
LTRSEPVRELAPYVCEIAGADHGMFVPDQPLAVSAAVLGTVVTAVANFLDTVIRPDA